MTFTSKRILTIALTAALPIHLAAGCDEDEGTEPIEPTEETAQPTAEAEPAAAETESPAAVEGAAPEAEAEAETELAVGHPAPEFTLTDQAGTEHSLSQYRGKIVVLEWINPGCPFVQRHYQARTMRALADEFADDDVVWLAVDSSNFVQPEDSEAWREEHGLPYPILQDPSGDTGRLYDARTTPHMYVVDAEGVLRYRGAIDDDPRGQAEGETTNYVEAAVRSLLAGETIETSETEPYGCTVKYDNT